MQQILPSVSKAEMLCAEIRPGPCGFVVFGASGDLTRRKLLVSIFELFRRDLLSEQFFLLGAGRKEFSDAQFRQIAREAIRSQCPDATGAQINTFSDMLYYISGDYNQIKLYENIKSRVGQLSKKHKVSECVIFYLAVPPVLYGTIAAKLGAAKLSCKDEMDLTGQVRLVVEKPFGCDTESARRLNDNISLCFDESQVYRIDHYLGKETVQNILMFRFANTIFEPVWNRSYIDSVQITIAEKLGVEHRGSYYDGTGALRDMFQNHVLQMLSLAAMEAPTSFQADSIRDEKVKVLRSVRPFTLQAWSKDLVRGQYTQGVIDSEKVPPYLQEQGVKADSKTETFVAARLFIDNWRWKDVPFYLRSGKRLSCKDTEVAITFKKVPHSMFESVGLGDMPANTLVLQIQPEEGISLSFQAKRPGSKICMSTLHMNFDYKRVFGVAMPEAYQRLLLDCMVGDQTLFARFDAVDTAWQLLAPVLQAWDKQPSRPYEYPAGNDSFPQADALIESDGRKWRPLGGT